MTFLLLDVQLYIGLHPDLQGRTLLCAQPQCWRPYQTEILTISGLIPRKTFLFFHLFIILFIVLLEAYTKPSRSP